MRALEMYVCILYVCCILAVFLHVEGVGSEAGVGTVLVSERAGGKGGEMRGNNANGNLIVDKCERKNESLASQREHWRQRQ
jgi:hypothetical protein